eukprot:9698-Heterococcus_DN1.PRE.7
MALICDSSLTQETEICRAEAKATSTCAAKHGTMPQILYGYTVMIGAVQCHDCQLCITQACLTRCWRCEPACTAHVKLYIHIDFRTALCESHYVFCNGKRLLKLM